MDLSERTILITGGTSGIGYETALQLARLKARVIITYRDEKKGLVAAERIRMETGNSRIFPMHCRLDSFLSIREFALEFRKTHPSLNVLINNAGIWETSRSESEDGFEMTWAVNHLAPFLLTHLLLPLMRTSTPARIINLSSEAHKSADIHWDDPEFKGAFPFMKAYSQSKLANILFTRKLAHVLYDSGITVNCVHPGVVNTSIFNQMNSVMLAMFKPFTIPPHKGAITSVYLASSPEVEKITGAYFKKCKQAKTSVMAMDEERADKLWQLSLQYTKNDLSEV